MSPPLIRRVLGSFARIDFARHVRSHEDAAVTGPDGELPADLAVLAYAKPSPAALSQTEDRDLPH